MYKRFRHHGRCFFVAAAVALHPPSVGLSLVWACQLPCLSLIQDSFFSYTLLCWFCGSERPAGLSRRPPLVHGGPADAGLSASHPDPLQDSARRAKTAPVSDS